MCRILHLIKGIIITFEADLMTKLDSINTVLRRQSFYILLVFFAFLSICCKAQTTDTTAVHVQKKITDTLASSNQVAADSTHKVADSTKQIAVVMKPKIFQPIPKKAGLFSAILPGAGQFYNRQYWKIPIIYGGLAVAAYFINDNLNNYLDFRQAYISSINNSNRTDKYAKLYSTAQLQILQADYSKYLDLTVLFTGIGYIVQILDAVAYAHLHNFDISEDLSLRIKPVAFPQGAGIGLVVNFK